MSKAIGKIKPKRVKVIVHEDGTREVVEVNQEEELGEVSMPKVSMKKSETSGSADAPAQKKGSLNVKA